MGRRAAGLLVLAGAVAYGCASIIGADFDAHQANAIATDAGDEAGGSDAPAGCQHAEPPRNAAQGKNLGGTTELWVGVYTVDYGDGDGVPANATYSKLGYDIDRVCTSQGEAPTCVLGKHAVKDGDDGRDNAAGELFFEIKATYPTVSSPIGSKKDTALIQSGAYSVIFHVSGYNGQPDDDQVRFEWYVPASFGADKSADGGASQIPAWNGTDRWPLRKDGTTTLPDGGAGPLVADDNAYVAGGVVVASLPRGSKIRGGSVEFDLSGVFVTAKINQTPQGLELDDGMFAGTWGQTQVLSGLGALFEAVGQCTDFPIYQQLKGLVCGALDVSSAGVPLPTEPCDALSIGFAFTTRPIVAPVNVMDVPLPTTPCPPATDPANDSCGAVVRTDAGTTD